MLGISIRHDIGIGDKVQFSSLPENYFRATGKKLVDVSRAWIYDFNPYVTRDEKATDGIIELWSFPMYDPWPNPRVYKTDPAVYLSNAEAVACKLKVPVVLNRPRLYRFEDFPFTKRQMILLQVNGKSHGSLPDQIIDHVLKKYKSTGQLVQIGLENEPDLGIPKIKTGSFWDLAEVISQARMVIGPDSGPSWIGMAYPDVIVKKVKLRVVHGQKAAKDWVPLEISNMHAHWDDRACQIFNPSEDDVGFMPSYKRI